MNHFQKTFNKQNVFKAILGKSIYWTTFVWESICFRFYLLILLSFSFLSNYNRCFVSFSDEKQPFMYHIYLIFQWFSYLAFLSAMDDIYILLLSLISFLVSYFGITITLYTSIACTWNTKVPRNLIWNFLYKITLLTLYVICAWFCRLSLLLSWFQ